MPRSAKAQNYGDRKRREDAMAVVPVAGSQAAPSPAQNAAPANPSMTPPPALPGQLTPLNAPTQNPAEPLLAGVNVGEGPGPMIQPMPMMSDDMMVMRQIATLYPTEAILDLVERNGR